MSDHLPVCLSLLWSVNLHLFQNKSTTIRPEEYREERKDVSDLHVRPLNLWMSSEQASWRNGMQNSYCRHIPCRTPFLRIRYSISLYHFRNQYSVWIKLDSSAWMGVKFLTVLFPVQMDDKSNNHSLVWNGQHHLIIVCGM